jgi:6-phosphogluconolactonase
LQELTGSSTVFRYAAGKLKKVGQTTILADDFIVNFTRADRLLFIFVFPFLVSRF